MQFLKIALFSLIASCGAVAFMGGSMHEANTINNMAERQEKLTKQMQNSDENISTKKKKRVTKKAQKPSNAWNRGALKYLVACLCLASVATTITFIALTGFLWCVTGLAVIDFGVGFASVAFPVTCAVALAYSAAYDFEEYEISERPAIKVLAV